MEFELKIRNKVYTLTEKDRIFDNGTLCIIRTQPGEPYLTKANAKKWKKDGTLIQCGVEKGYFDIEYPIYKFAKVPTL